MSLATLEGWRAGVIGSVMQPANIDIRGLRNNGMEVGEMTWS